MSCRYYEQIAPSTAVLRLKEVTDFHTRQMRLERLSASGPYFLKRTKNHVRGVADF